VIRKAIDIQNVTPTEAEETTSNTKKMKLAQTIGNGVAGEPPSHYMTSNVPKIEDLVWDLVLLGPGSHRPDKSYKNPPTTPRRKSILIKAGIGSENFAHQDNNSDKELPFQAFYLYSKPEESFQ
jgi:hypothetical protein